MRPRLEDELDNLRDRLVKEKLESLWGLDSSSLRRAANEAVRVAETTGFPLLVFPGLFEEKAAELLNKMRRCTQVRRATRELLAA